MAHAAHHPVPHDQQCACCFEDISSSNYAEYLPYPHEENQNHPQWLPSTYCADCIEHLLKSQWSLYTEALAKTTCKAEQRRLLTRGPPINLRDDRALPCPANDEIHKLWYHHGNVEKEAKLEYSLVGEVSQGCQDDRILHCSDSLPLSFSLSRALYLHRNEIDIGKNKCNFIVWMKQKKRTRRRILRVKENRRNRK
jgi:hypothetical protein